MSDFFQRIRQEKYPRAAALFLIAATVLAYLPVFSAGFVWDDYTSLTGNLLIKAADGLGRFWATTQPTDYWPVTYSVLWAEWRLWGLHATGYHADSVILHVVEALLLWSVLRRLRIPGAYLAALLFALHPVNVESVAWIAQRKNLLAMLFSLLTLEAFLRSGAAEPAAATPTRGSGPWYGLSLAAFLLALLSKGSVAMLPFILVGVIAWRKRLTRIDFLRLAPFFAASVLFVAIDIWFQKHSAAGVIRQAGWPERLCDAGLTVWFYLGKALLPLRLSFVYPQWTVEAGRLATWLPLLAGLGLTAFLAVCATRRGPPAWARPTAAAWGYFGLMLVPVMGFADVYFMKYSLVADHYQHLAIIGILALGAAAWTRWRADGAALAVAVLLVAGLGTLTARQARLYHDSDRLFHATVDLNPSCWMAHNNLGIDAYAAGDYAGAEEHFRATLRSNPAYAEAANNLGNTLTQLGRSPEALGYFREAVRLNPSLSKAHTNLGNALLRLHQSDPAMAEYAAALRLDPADAEARNNLATELLDAGRTEEAIRQFQTALAFDPSKAFRHYNLALALAQAGRRGDAIAEYEATLRLRPDLAQAHNNLGLLLQAAGRPRQALAHFQEAVRLAPADAQARANLAQLRAQIGL
jgi:tetratricopeptide (TPR) repeat protein